MNLLLTRALFFASITSSCAAFATSSSLQNTQRLAPPSTSSIVFSTNEESNENEVPAIPTPQTDALDTQSESFTNEPKVIKPLDPLVVSLTQMDEETLNAPTTKLPILGEVPKDGSLIILAPAAAIAVIGFITSIYLIVKNGDAISEQIEAVNAVLSTPPVTENIVSDGCRGLCNNPGEQLDTMKGFMEGLSNKKANMLDFE
ncbi:hypothetical protein CTEN210_00784 [Chaetoceros tenuissimus]|uniref:Uncharacterized protein n=1 Tax=Chaetoceros tenuissimus TaxID=426638 RepID=A0AAD3CGR2_9STRA|nr:hypothetical protein CTEN210_00784 [Chaetoceros tenuissimus]